MKKIIIAYLLLQCCFAFNLQAQVDQVKRVELATLSEAIDFNVAPVGKDGVCAFYIDKKGKGDNQQTWVFKKLDTDLKEQWTKTYKVDDKKMYKEKDFNNGILYLLFMDNRHNTFSVISINIITGAITEVEDNLEKRTFISEFKVTNNRAYFTGTHKRNSILFSLDLQSKKRRDYPLESYARYIYIKKMETDESNGTINVAMETWNKKDRTFIVKTIDNKGGDKDFVLGDQSGDNSFVTAAVKQVQDGKQIVIGTYDSKSGAQGTD
jgi:hypothetical protein